MYCSECGALNDDSARFCSQCGAELTAASPFAGSRSAVGEDVEKNPFNVGSQAGYRTKVGFDYDESAPPIPGNIFEGLALCFKKYFVLRGRAGRAEFWYWILFQTLVNVGGWLFLWAFGVGATYYQGDFGFLGALGAGVILVLNVCWLVCALPTLALMIRRVHDFNLSGWALFGLGVVYQIVGTFAGIAIGAFGGVWFLLAAVPAINMIPTAIVGLIHGTEGPNRYGAAPERRTK